MSGSLTRAKAATMMQRMMMMTLCEGRRGEEGEGEKGRGRGEREGEERKGEGGKGEGCNIQGNVTDG